MNNSKTILVTGGAGFIGTHLTRKLCGMGYKVRVLDLKDPENRVNEAEYTRGDARDQAQVYKLLDGATAVYHLAATVSVPLCQKDPIDSYSHNFSATLAVLEAVRKRNEEAKGAAPIGVLFSSTAALYGAVGDDGRAVKESDVAEEFLSYYAAQKHASEHAISQYHLSYAIPASVFRFFNVYGIGQDPTSPYSGVISIFTKLAKEGKELKLNAGGTQTRDFISVHDIVAGLVAPLSMPREKWKARPMNLGTGEIITIKMLAETIIKIAGTGSKTGVNPPREGDVQHSRADITRAKTEIGFAPKVKLADGLAELMK